MRRSRVRFGKIPLCDEKELKKSNRLKRSKQTNRLKQSKRLKRSKRLKKPKRSKRLKQSTNNSKVDFVIKHLDLNKKNYEKLLKIKLKELENEHSIEIKEFLDNDIARIKNCIQNMETNKTQILEIIDKERLNGKLTIDKQDEISFLQNKIKEHRKRVKELVKVERKTSNSPKKDKLIYEKEEKINKLEKLIENKNEVIDKIVGNVSNITDIKTSKFTSVNIKPFRGNPIFAKLYLMKSQSQFKDLCKLISENYNNLMNEAGSDGNTLLHYAVSCDPSITDTLIQHGYDISAINNNGETALMLAKNDAIVNTLLNYMDIYSINIIDKDGNTAFLQFVRNNRFKEILKLMDKFANPFITNRNKESVYSILHNKIKNNIDIYRLNIDLKYLTKLYKYCKKYYNTISKNAANYINKKEFKPAEFYIIQINNPRYLNEIDENGNTLLHLAVLSESYNITKLLVSKSAKLNIQNINGDTPLMLTRNRGIAEVLINNMKSSDLNLVNKDGNNALILCSIDENVNDTGIAYLLLKRKVDVDHVNNDGVTLLDIIERNQLNLPELRASLDKLTVKIKKIFARSRSPSRKFDVDINVNSDDHMVNESLYETIEFYEGIKSNPAKINETINILQQLFELDQNDDKYGDKVAKLTNGSYHYSNLLDILDEIYILNSKKNNLMADEAKKLADFTEIFGSLYNSVIRSNKPPIKSLKSNTPVIQLAGIAQQQKPLSTGVQSATQQQQLQLLTGVGIAQQKSAMQPQQSLQPQSAGLQRYQKIVADNKLDELIIILNKIVNKEIVDADPFYYDLLKLLNKMYTIQTRIQNRLVTENERTEFAKFLEDYKILIDKFVEIKWGYMADTRKKIIDGKEECTIYVIKPIEVSETDLDIIDLNNSNVTNMPKLITQLDIVTLERLCEDSCNNYSNICEIYESLLEKLIRYKIPNYSKRDRGELIKSDITKLNTITDYVNNTKGVISNIGMTFSLSYYYTFKQILKDNSAKNFDIYLNMFKDININFMHLFNNYGFIKLKTQLPEPKNLDKLQLPQQQLQQQSQILPQQPQQLRPEIPPRPQQTSTLLQPQQHKPMPKLAVVIDDTKIDHQFGRDRPELLQNIENSFKKFSTNTTPENYIDLLEKLLRYRINNNLGVSQKKFVDNDMKQTINNWNNINLTNYADNNLLEEYYNFKKIAKSAEFMLDEYGILNNINKKFVDEFVKRKYVIIEQNQNPKQHTKRNKNQARNQVSNQVPNQVPNQDPNQVPKLQYRTKNRYPDQNRNQNQNQNQNLKSFKSIIQQQQ